LYVTTYGLQQLSWVVAVTMLSHGLYCLQTLQSVRPSQQEKKKKKKTTRFGINLMRSQVFYRAAQDQHSNVNKKQAIFTGNECAAILFEQQMFAHGLSQSSMHCITSEIFKHFLPL